MQKTIYLIRHGETEYNRQGVVQGSGIDADLNDLGVAQSQAFFEAYQDIPFQKIYTSKLKRTHQTVKGFLEKNILWEQYEGLNEISWGIREGKIPSSLDNEYYRELILAWRNGETQSPAEGGESPQDVQNRQIPVIETLISRPEEETILVAMHGRAIRILLVTMLNLPLKQMDDFEHHNLCLYKIAYHYDTQQFEILLADDVSHLASLPIYNP